MVNCKYLPNQPQCQPDDHYLVNMIALCWFGTVVLVAALVLLVWLDRRKKEK